MPRLIAHLTFRNFMKKYHLPTTEIINGKQKLKSVPTMRKQIHAYERKNAHNIKNGLYYNTPK